MTPTPKSFKWGGPKFQKAWKQMCAAVDDRTTWPGLNMSATDQPGYGRMLNAQASSSSASVCQFAASDASEGSTKKVGFSWGTINGIQPTGFAAGGLPAFTITVTETSYFYAAVTFNTVTLLPTSAEIIKDAAATKANTSTIAYKLIGSVNMADGAFVIAGTCGPIVVSACELDFS